MPRVNAKKFPYTKAGQEAARREAMQSGMPMQTDLPTKKKPPKKK